MADTALYSKIEATVNSYVSSYSDAVEAKDAAVFSRTLTADCERQLAPGSMFRAMNIPFAPKMDNAAYEDRMAQELVVLESNKIEALDMTIDTVGKKAGVRAASTLTLKGGNAFEIEFCWFLYFTDDGTKIKRILQFVDATGGSAFLAAMKEAASKEAETQ